MTPAERDTLIMQRCLARALRRAATRQRARLDTMRPALAATWRHARRQEP